MRKSRRPYVRNRRARQESGAARLAHLAGSSRSAVEQLEQRKLLFSLTITADDDAADGVVDGYGTISRAWGYVIPWLVRELPDATEPGETVVEDFDEEEQLPGTNVPSGLAFEESNIQITHNMQTVTWVQDPLDPDDLQIRVAYTVADALDEFVTFAFPGDEGAPRVVTQATFFFDPNDLPSLDPTTGIVVDFLIEGEVVESRSGADLAITNGNQLVLAREDGFEAVRFRLAGLGADFSFVVDQISFFLPPGRWGEHFQELASGIGFVLRGPVGATIHVLDLYGREMRLTTRIGPGDGEVAFVDPDDNGIPNYNDGIGRIELTGTDINTVFNLFGAEYDDQGNLVAPGELSLFPRFTEAGFGYFITPDGNAFGLPLGTGTLILGSPFVRDNSSEAAYFQSQLPQIAIQDNFSRTDQGVHVIDGSIGSVLVHGVAHGFSFVEGAAARYNVGFQPGSLSVEGDLGAFYIASDAARLVNPQNSVVSTGGVLSVGRTLGQVAIGGASFMDVTVVGDINNPNRPVVDYLTYNELEVVYGIDPATEEGIRVINGRTFNTINPAFQAILFGDGHLRNDTIGSAEYVGYNGAAVIINGRLGQMDPYNTASDPSDVYAFAADGSTDVVVEISFDTTGQNFNSAMARIVDRNGIVVAAHEHPDASFLATATGVQFRFRPDSAGVYYLVIATPIDDSFSSSLAYTATLSGIAPTTLGQHRTGGGLSDARVASNLINVQAGATGLISVGSGFVGGDGAEQAGDSITLFGGSIDGYNHLATADISIASHLYGIHTGSDVAGTTINIGGNLGAFATGRSALVGFGPTEGDIASMTLNVGAQIGVLDIAGALAWNQDGANDAPPGSSAGPVFIRTGVAGEPGHIGQILVGAFVYGGEGTPAVVIDTPAGSTVGMFRVGTLSEAGMNGNIDGGIPQLRLGIDSDIRFVDFQVLDSDTDPDALRFIGPGQSIQLTDDAGAAVTISIVGGTGTDSGAFIRFLPISGSQGVAIARIDATLLGGAVLSIRGDTPGRVSIGTINITTDGTTDVFGELQSALRITGANTEIDVWRVNVLDAPLGLIENRTPNGDIVMIDAIGLDRLSITGGHLGRTETVGIGPKLYGAFMGIAPGEGGDVGGPLGFDPASINRDFDGIFIPVNQPTAGDDEAFLEDLGSPFDPWLNGLVVRTGDVSSIIVAGAVGDVLIMDGVLESLRANSDGVTPFGAFHGIVGTIYANTITLIDVGDGLAEAGPSPFAAAGIFADGNIETITTRAALGAVLSGPIIAGAESEVGIDNIVLNGARLDGAFVGVSNFDAFWSSARYFGGGNPDDVDTFGLLNRITGTNSDMFRTEILATNVNVIRLVGGVWDANHMIVRGNINQVQADQFRNSTLFGDPLEFRLNRIEATGNINRLETTGGAGDMVDLEIDILQSITGAVVARNLIRVRFDVDNTIARMTVNNDIRASQFITGELNFVNVTNDIRSSDFLVAGPINSILANNMTSVLISSTGPDGRIGTITAQFYLTGDIRASGPITTISSVFADVIGSITTTDFDGTLMTLSAGNDLLVNLDIAADAHTIRAGRHIGRQGETPDERAIFIRGNLNTIESPNGQIYTAVRVGEAIVGAIRMGRVAAMPGNDLVSTASFEAFKRIALIDIQGDFGGDIVSRSGGIGQVNITRGSFRPGASITTFDGGIDAIIVMGGHFMGDVTSAEHIGTIQVLALDGFNGDLGINPNLSQFIGFDAFRNQLPPGAEPDPTFQGPTIRAGTNITSIIVDSASMWETGIYARHSIGLVSIRGVIMNDHITPGLAGSYIVAGDAIDQVIVGEFVGGLLIHAGILDFGADDRPGGTGADADTVKFGFINNVDLLHAGAVTVSAGGLAGEDGQYGLDVETGLTDDLVANGRSAINRFVVRGTAVLTTAFADNGFGEISSNVILTGPGQRQEDPGKVIEAVPTTGLIPKGVPFAFTTVHGETGTIIVNGPGDAYWDQSLGQLAIINSTFDTSLEVIADNGVLTDFHIISNDGASIGNAIIRAALFGSSSFYFDGFVVNAVFGGIAAPTGFFGAGRDIGTMVFGPFLTGEIFANHIQNLIIGADFGLRDQAGEAVMNLLSAGTITVFEDIHADINSQRDIGVLAARDIDRGAVRSGRSIGSITARNVSESRISAFNDVLTVNIAGDMFDSFIYAGADLGSDAAFGGTGTAADRVSNGTINTVNIGGNFRESDISAGVLRGADGFLGTDDDIIAAGRSTIGTVTIGGTQVGSAFGSESYRIISTGTIGSVTVGGAAFTQGRNLRVTAMDTRPAPVEVLDLRTTESGRSYTTAILFNQPIDSSTLSAALSIEEVRSGFTIPLTEGTDYTVTWDSTTNTAFINYSTAITNRNLADAGALPAPGIYRVRLDAEILRGQTAAALLDGDGDGIGALTDDFADETIVGDAGDKLVQGTGAAGATTVDFYAPANLDLVFNAGANPNGLPDPNQTFTVRGTLGDHQDNNLTTFRIGSDVDLYSITLQAGQILRMSAIQGSAALAERVLLDATGALVNFSQAVTLPTGVLDDPNAIPGVNILIKQTGTYILAISSGLGQFDITDPTSVTNIPAVAGASGAYNFTLEVFDDGDSGFRANTDAGNGVDIVNAPLPSNAGFDTGPVTIGDYTFHLNVGPDGIRNTADDIVSGSNPAGFFSMRTAGADGVFGTADDRRTTSVGASLGRGSQTGAPRIVEPDVDIFHLNNGQTIAPGTLITATLRLTEFGSNLGLSSVQDLRGAVQFAIFDTSASTAIDDALLVAAPTDALPVGSQTPRTITDGVTAYGYDANGDFFITFVVPPRQDVAGNAPGTFALYIQGAIRSDYVLEVVTEGTRTFNRSSQNVLLETSGGVIDWLEAGGIRTELEAFTSSVVGFSGRVGGQTVDQYIISSLVSNLNAIFLAANVNIIVSTNPLDFENQDHSTIFLTRSNAPAAFFNNNTFGAVEHADPFNTDRNDEGVVFAPSLALLGNTPDQAGIDSFIDSLTAAVGRRIGELVGLRAQANTGETTNVPLMAANSVTNTPGGGSAYRFSNTDLALSTATDALTDTDFYLGRQNSVNLLDRILADRF